MPNFDTKKLEFIKGKQVFYQLTLDDKADFSGAVTEEEINGRKTGILDIYEREMESIYKKDLVKIYAYMDMVANNKQVPGTKYHELDRDKNDPYPDFEFKHGDLRVYGAKIPGGKILLLGSYKNKEQKNIIRLRSLKKQYFESIKQKK
jgi:hypothetical protein